MGLTCSSAHLLIEDAFNENRFDSVWTAAGYTLVEGELPSTCDVVVVFEERWISIYEPQASGFISKDSAELSCALSAALRAPMLLAVVYDSDEFAYLLIDSGKQVDAHASRADLLPVRSKTTSMKKRAELFSNLFASTVTVDDIKSFTRPPGIFADQQLGELCRAVGLPVHKSMISMEELTSSGSRIACFCRESDPSAVRQTITFENDLRAVELVVGQTYCVPFEIVIPITELSHPIAFEVTGSVIHAGLAEAKEVNGGWYCKKDLLKKKSGVTYIDWRIAESDNGVTVSISSQELTPDMVRNASEPVIVVVCWINLVAKADGHGELSCRLIYGRPLSRRHVDLMPRYEFSVEPTTWIPRCGFSNSACEQDGIRMMNMPRILSSVGIFEDHDGKTLTELKRQAEDWILARAWPELARIETFYEGQMNPDTFHVPRKKVRIGCDEIRDGKKWDRLFTKQLQSLFVNVCVDDGAAIGGVTIQRAIQDEETTGEGTVHFGIWVRAAGDNSSTDVERDRTHFTSLMDLLFSSLPGLQAWTANWDWVPRFTMAEENNYTPYEDATSIYLIRQRPCINLETAWCGRYLRAVSQQMWLHRSLLQHVDRDSLRNVVNETPLDNDIIRIDLLPNCHLTQLEEVLSPVIPPPELIQA